MMSWKFAEMRWRQDAGIYETYSERWSGLKNKNPEGPIDPDDERAPLDHDKVATVGTAGSIETEVDFSQPCRATGRGIRNRSAGRPPSMSPPPLPHQECPIALHSSFIPLLHLPDHSCHARGYSKSIPSSITRPRSGSDSGPFQSHSTLSHSSAKSPRDFTLEEHSDPEMANLVKIAYRKLKARIRRRREKLREPVVDPVIDPVVDSAAGPTSESPSPEREARSDEDIVTATQENVIIDQVMSLGDAQHFAKIVFVQAQQPVLAPLQTTDNSPLVRNCGHVDLASLVQNSPPVGSIIEDAGQSLTLQTEPSASTLTIGQERPVSPLDLLPGEVLPTSRLGGMGLACLERRMNMSERQEIVSELVEVGKLADYGRGGEILGLGPSHHQRRAGNYPTYLSAGIKTLLICTPQLRPQAPSIGAACSAYPSSIHLLDTAGFPPIMTSADSQSPIPTQKPSTSSDYELDELTPEPHPSNSFLTSEEVKGLQNDVEDSKMGLLHPANDTEKYIQSAHPFISTQDDEEGTMHGNTAPDDRFSNPFISKEDSEEEKQGQDDGSRDGKEEKEYQKEEDEDSEEETEELNCTDFAPENHTRCLTNAEADLSHKTYDRIHRIAQTGPSVLPFTRHQSANHLHKDVRLSKLGVFNPVDLGRTNGRSIDPDTSMRRGQYGYNSESASLTHLMDRAVYANEITGARHVDCETTHFFSRTSYPRKGIFSRFSQRASKRTSQRTDIPDFTVGRYEYTRQDPFLVDPTPDKGKGRIDTGRINPRVAQESAVIAENSRSPGSQTAITGITTKNGLMIGRPRPFPIPSTLSPKNSLFPRTEETHPLLADDVQVREAGPNIAELLLLQQSDWERLKSNCPVFPLNEDHIDLVFQSGRGRVRREPGLRSDGRVGEQMYCGSCERWEFSHQPELMEGREAERVEERIDRVEMAKKVLWAVLGFLVLVFLVASAVVIWNLLG